MIRNPLTRAFSMSCVHSKKMPTKAKSHSSHQWLSRQMTDPFVEMAKMKNYRFVFVLLSHEYSHIKQRMTKFDWICRCRSAFKLLEINDRTKILQPGHTVIDCGAAPGSWTQIAVTETNADGKMKKKPTGFVIGLDLLFIHPIEVVAFYLNLIFKWLMQ